MILRILRRLGVKIVIYRTSHEVLNATTSIAGILAECRKCKRMGKGHYEDIIFQLGRIEKAICFVRQMNRGCE